MTDDPFLQLVCDALGLMNKAVMYPPCSEWRETGRESGRLFAQELYHQIRKLWDRGITVGMGLGHLLFRHEPGHDLAVHRRPDGGGPDEPFGLIGLTRSEWSGDDELSFRPWVGPLFESLDTARRVKGYRYAVAVTLGSAPSIAPPTGVTHVNFDLDRWTARVI